MSITFKSFFSHLAYYCKSKSSLTRKNVLNWDTAIQNHSKNEIKCLVSLRKVTGVAELSLFFLSLTLYSGTENPDSRDKTRKLITHSILRVIRFWAYQPISDDEYYLKNTLYVKYPIFVDVENPKIQFFWVKSSEKAHMYLTL